MYRVNGIFTTKIAGEDILSAVRVKNPETDETKLLDPHELNDPDSVSLEEEDAYKVSFASAMVDSKYGTYEFKHDEDQMF